MTVEAKGYYAGHIFVKTDLVSTISENDQGKKSTGPQFQCQRSLVNYAASSTLIFVSDFRARCSSVSWPRDPRVVRRQFPWSCGKHDYSPKAHGTLLPLHQSANYKSTCTFSNWWLVGGSCGKERELILSHGARGLKPVLWPSDVSMLGVISSIFFLTYSSNEINFKIWPIIVSSFHYNQIYGRLEKNCLCVNKQGDFLYFTFSNRVSLAITGQCIITLLQLIKLTIQDELLKIISPVQPSQINGLFCSQGCI